MDSSPAPTTIASTGSGSGIVQRGLLVLALMVVVVAGGYFLLFRRSGKTPPPPLLEPEPLLTLLTTPHASFPGALSWGALVALADNLPSQPGWEIRYTAASSLARRGEGDVPWDVLREMLDENQQFRNSRFRLEDGRLVPDEAAARRIMLSGLQAVAAWHAKQAKATVQVKAPLRAVYDAVDKLARSPIAEMRVQAEKTKAKLFR